MMMALRRDTKEGQRVFVSDRSAAAGSLKDRNKIEVYIMRNKFYTVMEIKRGLFYSELRLNEVPFIPFNPDNFENFDV